MSEKKIFKNTNNNFPDQKVMYSNIQIQDI